MSERRRKLFAWATFVGLDRDERIELACYLLRRDITSWKDLDDAQVDRMLDALEGYNLVRSLIELRAGHRDDGVVTHRHD